MTNYSVIRDGDGNWYVQRLRPRVGIVERVRRLVGEDKKIRLMCESE